MGKEITRNKSLIVRVSEDELAELSARAQKAGMNASDMVRSLLQGEAVVIAPVSSITAGHVRREVAKNPAWVAEAINEKLYPPEPLARSTFAPPQRTSAAALAASIPGVRLGIPEPPMAEEPDKWEGEDFEKLAIAEFGQAIVRRCFRELPWFKKATWPVRLERLREMKEAGAGS